MDIIDLIQEEVKEKINEYKDNSKDHYDFWNEHIKYVYVESQKLAKKYAMVNKIYTGKSLEMSSRNIGLI